MDYNKRLRLEEAWILLLESMHPKGLNSRLLVLKSWSLKETTLNYQVELEWHNLEMISWLLYFYQPNANCLLGESMPKQQSCYNKNHCKKSLKYGKNKHFNW